MESNVRTAFDPAAARKAAFSDTIQHPVTLAGAALAFLGLGAAAVFTLPWLAIVGGVGALAGSLNWALRFFGGRETYEKKFYERITEEFEKLKEEKGKKLASDLDEYGCPQGSIQVDQFEEKFNSLRDVLRRVVSEGELTFSRYISTVQLVYTSGLQNLDRIITILIPLNGMNRTTLTRQIGKLEGCNRSPAEDRSLAALRARAKLFDDGMTEIADLLAQNEEALTAIDQASMAVGNIKSNGKVADDLQYAMADLVSLISRAKQRAAVNPLVEEMSRK